MIYRVGAPKHNAISKVICFKTPCRGVIGWKRTQQRNKFKSYKKPSIPRLQYLKEDSLRTIEKQSLPVVEDTVSVAASQPAKPDSVIVFNFNDVLFERNSSDLSDEFMRQLDSVSLIIRTHGRHRLSVVGHTDNSGSEMSNAMLSQQRAEAVASYLVATGIDGRLISAAGRGSSDPVADNSTAEGRRMNRRVQIFLEMD